MRSHKEIKFFILAFLLLFLCSSNSFHLNYKEVRRATELMLKLHVEYKEFSPSLARRSLKLFIDQFDPEKIYLLGDEILPFLEPKENNLREITSQYHLDRFSYFEALNTVIQKAIMRARALRTQGESVVSETSQVQPMVYSDFAKTPEELALRIQRHQEYLFDKERQYSHIRKWTDEQKYKVFDLWENRIQRVENTYLKKASEAEHNLTMHILKAVAKSLDAHSAYYTPEEAHEMRASLEKQFHGIGVMLRESIEGVCIVGLVKGGPAERSGQILIGDVITKIDGKSIRGLSYDEILNRLQGTGNSHLQLQLKRLSQDKEATFNISLSREKIILQEERLQYSAEPCADGIIGKLILPSFYESPDGSSCEKDIREALRALKKQGKLVGVILDLRDNSGGFLNQAVKVAGLFISSGVVVISKYAQGETHYMRNLDIRSYYEGPLIVLTSKASASAAEIVAQALQDYGTALVVGDDRTYGKGTIQYQTVTDQQAACFFKVTVGRYYTVSGRSTQIDGVRSDIHVPTAYAPIPIGERFLEFPLKSDRVPSAYVDPLTDIDQKNHHWFQQNYLPNLQKKLSVWVQMLDYLKKNTEQRLSEDKDFKLFLKALEEVKKGRTFSVTPYDNWGSEDLQLSEAVRIIKDMMCINCKSAVK